MIRVGDILEIKVVDTLITREVTAENLAQIQTWINWGAEVKRIG